jgi:hypothetical protein
MKHVQFLLVRSLLKLKCKFQNSAFKGSLQWKKQSK